MTSLDGEALRDFVNEEIVKFHQARLERLQRLKLQEVLRKKNPYLFKAKNINVASDLVAAVILL